MQNSKPIPISLTSVAVLFILGGISAVIEIIVSLMNNHININFGVLGLFIGPGLLRLSRGWRGCALVFLWIAIIGTPIVAIAIMFFAHSGPLDFTLFGQKAGHVSKEIGLAIAAIVFVIAWWQYRVLTRPDIRQLFGLSAGQQDAAADAKEPRR